jgi:hypothetical protein
MDLQFGMLADPLHQQLGVEAAGVEHFQRDADAIARLHVRGVLSDAETHRARKRLIKRLNETLDTGA